MGKRAKQPAGELAGYKVTRPDGTDFYSGTVNYARACEMCEPLVHDDPQPPTGEVCGRGFHVSPTPQQAIGYASGSHRPWRFWEVAYNQADVIERDNSKLRLSRLSVTREMTLADIFGRDFQERVAGVKKQTKGWASIPWLTPARPIRPAVAERLFAEWHEALSPWASLGRSFPAKMRIVTDYVTAATAATAATADATDADATDAAAARLIYYRSWYARPRWVLRRHARWQIAGLKQPNPFAPLVKLYEMGAWPIGYVRGEFVIYCPPCEAKKRRRAKAAA